MLAPTILPPEPKNLDHDGAHVCTPGKPPSLQRTIPKDAQDRWAWQGLLRATEVGNLWNCICAQVHDATEKKTRTIKLVHKALVSQQGRPEHTQRASNSVDDKRVGGVIHTQHMEDKERAGIVDEAAQDAAHGRCPRLVEKAPC